MKKILIFGKQGMLGNALEKYFKKNRDFLIVGTSRKKISKDRIFFDIDENFRENVFNIIKLEKPEYILNCIGFIRPTNAYKDFKKAILINSIFPQILAQICLVTGIHLIHFSTDCVFSGRKGSYGEMDISDEVSVYGISKYLGELRQPPNLTIRTSIIGRGKGTKENLLDWFLNTTDKEIKGYKKVIWNGITTLTMAKIVERIIEKDLNFEKSLIQITSNKLSKYDLLNYFKEIFEKDIQIIPEEKTISDNTLIPSVEQTKYFQDLIPSLYEQTRELKDFYLKDYENNN